MKAKTIKINKYVAITFDEAETKNRIIVIKNTKSEEREIVLYEKTLKKILEKIS